MDDDSPICRKFRPGETYAGKQGFRYAAGISAESAGARGICMHLLTLQPGDRAKALGAKRVVPLAVSAPFHCALMKPAEERLAPELRALQVRDPRVPVVANVDAEPKRDSGAAIEALVRQVSAPVLWDAVVRRLASEGVTTYVEVGPGTVLAGLVRKIDREARVASFGAPEQLAAVEALFATS